MELTKCKLGELITQRREKNDGSPLPICGVSKDGLIPPKQTRPYIMFFTVMILYLIPQEWNSILLQ